MCNGSQKEHRPESEYVGSVSASKIQNASLDKTVFQNRILLLQTNIVNDNEWMVETHRNQRRGSDVSGGTHETTASAKREWE